MSFSRPARNSALVNRASEIHQQAILQLRVSDPLLASIYQEGIDKEGFDLSIVHSISILFWVKGFDGCFLQPYNGNLTMKDLCTLGQSVEEDVSPSADYLSDNAFQYAALRVVESTRAISKANVGVFAINTCNIHSGERVAEGIIQIRERLHMNRMIEQNIFDKEFLMFPIHRNGEAGCIVIVNPSALVIDGRCMLILITNSGDSMFDVRENIETILDDQRIRLHNGREFKGGEISYDYVKEIMIPSFHDSRCDSQLQLLYIMKKVLENHANIWQYMHEFVDNMGQDVNEMYHEMKGLRLRLLREIAYDIHGSGTELQRYLYERRIRELIYQERERKKSQKHMNVYQTRGKMFCCFPAIDRVLQ